METRVGLQPDYGLFNYYNEMRNLSEYSPNTKHNVVMYDVRMMARKVMSTNQPTNDLVILIFRLEPYSVRFRNIV